MIKNWFITGDVHGKALQRLANLTDGNWTPEETALIILGDAGFNFFLNKTDWKNKKNVQNTGYHIYCVRGNHEERPERIPGMAFAYDTNVGNGVWYEPEFPNIRYFCDGGVYIINGKRTLVIGGAYSIDKWYRLHRIGVLTEHQISRDAAAKVGWFMDEQLSKYEMEKIQRVCAGDHFDVVLSHTCPLDWEPRDLFLSGIDQSKVDKSMENWMNEFKDQITWSSWLFGHFHDNRLIQEGVKMLYDSILLWEDVPQKNSN